MRFIGNIYGKDVFLDTEDDAIAEAAVRFLEHLKDQSLKFQLLEMEKEINDFKKETKPQSLWKRLLSTLNK